MRNTSRLSAVLCLCLFGCGDQTEFVHTGVNASALPIALDTQLVFVDGSNQRAYLLDAAKARPDATAKRVELPAGASLSERRRERLCTEGNAVAADCTVVRHDEALILCAGQRGGPEQDAEQAALVAIDGAGKSRTYSLGTTPFNTLEQSDDGRYAVLYRSGKDSSRTLNNPNELVVVDLDKAPDEEDAVTRKTPDGLGHTLTRVIVSPSMRIAKEDRRLLVVLSAAEVTLFDLNHLDRRATIVQLDETRLINPVQVLFGNPNPTLYVRAANSDNIFMFRFEMQGDNPGGNDFRPTINPIGGGSGPRDMVLFGEGVDERLLVIAENSSQALVIDPSSSKTTALKLAMPPQHIVLFTASSPRDAQTRTRAVLYADNRNSVTFLDLNDLADSPEDKLEVLPLENPIASMISLVDENELVFLHAQGVTLLNLAERTLTPISASGALSGAIFDPLHKRLWVGPAGTPWVGTLDLETGKTDEIRLDADIRAIVPMIEAKRLAVLHGSELGYVTFLDLDNPTRDSAVSVRGFFISGSFDRGAE
jgi:hypothetical protein